MHVINPTRPSSVDQAQPEAKAVCRSLQCTPKEEKEARQIGGRNVSTLQMYSGDLGSVRAKHGDEGANGEVLSNTQAKLRIIILIFRRLNVFIFK